MRSLVIFQERPTPKKLYLWFKYKSFGDIITLPMLKLSIICLNQPNCTFDSRVRMLIVVCMLESNVQQAWLKHIILNLSMRNFGAYPRILCLNQTCSFFRCGRKAIETFILKLSGGEFWIDENHKTYTVKWDADEQLTKMVNEKI